MSSFQIKLFANGAGKRVFDFRVPRYWSDSAICRIQINVVIRTVSFEVATAINQTSHKLSPLHSEIDSSCFSSGINEFSAASSTIRR